MCFDSGATHWHQPATSRPALGQTTHWLMFAVDIASYSRRDPDIQQHLRAVLYQIMRDSCDASDMPWDACYYEDRGDSIFVLAPAGTSIEAFSNKLVLNLQTRLRTYNKTAIAEAQIRLRLAVHAGWATCDAQGLSGDAVNHLFRILEAPALKNELAAHGGELALIVSARLYEDVVRYNAGPIAPDSLRPILVEVKETREQGWIWLPPGGRQTPPPIRRPGRMRRDAHPRLGANPSPLINHIRRGGGCYGDPAP